MAPRAENAEASDDDLYSAPPRTSRVRAASPSSDKENAPSSTPAKRGKGDQPQASSSSNSTSRRRSNGSGLQEMDVPATQNRKRPRSEIEEDISVYDPDQDPAERRKVRGSYRQMHRDVDDGKHEFLQPGNNGIRNVLLRAEKEFKNVKQTSDAVLDSNLIVKLAEMGAKRAQKLNGSSGAGIDVDMFTTRCVQFMRKSGPQRGRVPNEELELADDAVDFARLGREAAFKCNKRPALIDFMLGPLSVQKRVRIQRAKRQGLSKKRGQEAQRPVEMNTEDIKQSENSTLKVVHNIQTFLHRYFAKNQLEDLNLFEVVCNPRSFSQTVENVFYVSFLVREGTVAIYETEEGLRLALAERAAGDERTRDGIVRHQMIFPLTMWDWKQAIEVYDIKECIIPTRQKEAENVSATGWYTG